jgi:UDP-N-acetylglucosamine acyltransferase
MIHSSAIVHPNARLAPDVEIGPFAIVGAHVEIGAGSTVGSHCVIDGHTRMGRGNRVFSHCSLGQAPQDKKYAGEPTRLEIGDGNTFREFCTVNTGTTQDIGVTRIGDDNWIMAYVHIAHDCQVGDHTIFANNATLAGHVHIGDWAILGGFTGVHQFCKVGAHVIIGIASVVRQDIPPYITASGQPAAPFGINSEGLKRRGFTPDAIAAVKRAYKTLYREGKSLDEALALLAADAERVPELSALVEFARASERGIIR